MDRNIALDAIETYGSDRSKWPVGASDFIDDLAKIDEEIGDALRRQQKLDDMLSEWSKVDDGSGVEDELDDDEDDGAALDDEGEPEEDSSDDGSGIGSDRADTEEMEVDTSGDPSDGDDADGESTGSGPGDDEAEPDWTDELTDADLEELKDADAILAEMIAGEMKEATSAYFAFTKDYDIAEKIVPPAYTTTAHIDREVAQATGALQKHLQRLIVARQQAQFIPGQRRGRLHGPSLHRVMSGDDRVFRKKEQAKTVDTAISLLIDCSGSMNRLAEGHRSRIQVAVESAYAISQVLSKINVSFEVLGFTATASAKDQMTAAEWTEYREEVRKLTDSGVDVIRDYPLFHPIFKEFAEPFTPAIAKRFAAAHQAPDDHCGMEQNVDGESLEYAARRLMTQKAVRKILIVLSDGEPASYNGISKGGRQFHSMPILARDLRERVKKIQAAGVEVIGIGIVHPGVKHFYNNCEVINNVGSLPQALMGQLKKLLVN